MFWRDIPDYEGLYEVSSEGQVRRPLDFVSNIRSTWGGKVIASAPSEDGYLCANLWKYGKIKGFSVHRVVAAAFNGPCPDGLEVNHIDGDKLNNSPANLEYVTHRYNVRHAIRLGLHRPRIGADNGRAKLTPEAVLCIRADIARGVPGTVIAEKHRVGPTQISRIKKRKAWAHV